MRTFARIMLTAIVLATVLVPATNAGAQRARCVRDWGSRAEISTPYSRGHITEVKVGRHRCFDRLVIDLDGETSGYRVRYVKRLRQDGSGHRVEVDGRAVLRIIALAPAYDDRGSPTVDPGAVDELEVARFRSFRDIAWAGSFEGQTTMGIGLRARLPFRVFTLDGPGDGSRVVVDVAHRR